MNPLVVATTMAKRGMLAPGPPQRTARQLLALRRWGFGLAGELRQAASRSPKAVAVIDEQRGAVTYAELLARSERAATVLADLGAAPGTRVGLLARNHVGAVEILFGASAIGVDLVLLNTGLSAEQLALVAAQQELVTLVHDDEFGPVVAALPDALTRIDETAFTTRLEALPEPAPLSPPARAGRTIILTSGTTGTPKGAARKTPGGFGPLVTMIDRIPLRARGRILISAPIFHTWGFAALQLATALRAIVILQRRFDPAQVRATIGDERVDAVFAVPVMLQRMLELPDDGRSADRSRLRVVATSGSAYPSGFTTRFMDAYGEVLYNLYGSTEASWISIATPAHLRRHADTAGTPPLGTIVRLVGEDGRDVPDGERGRIFCGNGLVFEGYTAGAANKEFLDGLVATGDVGHREGGLLFVDGRDDDMIISGGENVFPSEVESALIDHPAIREVAVVGVPDADFGQRLAAFVVLHEGHAVTADEVREHVRSRRARHVVPRDVVVLDELPRNATGKVLYRELRERA
ncbi:AMP-binding protein [Janibacter sp. G56]|uniref:AMP-binding protein n=1 Tax=Janibacter sp. G56 TaxID=3418717 RepID=UPI003D0229D6